VLRDLDTIEQINRIYAAVSLTITTSDDELSKKLEPGAPPSSRRFAAIRALADRGIHTGVLLIPVLPFIEDSEENIRQIIEMAHDNSAGYIIRSFGMTMRDRQRDHFYRKLDEHFPGLRRKYEHRYGNRYGIRVPNANRLEELFAELCQKYDIAASMPKYGEAKHKIKQPKLF
jgi:DNA repair photolyase